MYENCAFTGHRILEKNFDYNLLDRVVLNLIKGGTKNFYCGMATGFDMAAAESVLQYKKDFDINLIPCIPCLGQEESYSQKNKERYLKILEKCGKTVILATEYYDGCMFARDRYMVDKCDVLVTYQRRKSGGTSYTVNYARCKGVNIIEL